MDTARWSAGLVVMHIAENRTSGFRAAVGDVQGLKTNAQAFEAMLLQRMVDSLMPKSEELFGGGAGADVWRSMLSEAVANELASSNTLGLSKYLTARLVPGGNGGS